MSEVTEVTPGSMTDAELDAALSASEETGDETVVVEGTTGTETQEATETATEAGTKAIETETTAAPEENTGTEQPDIAALRQEMQNRLSQQESFIQQLKSENGEFRKLALAQAAKMPQGMTEEQFNALVAQKGLKEANAALLREMMDAEKHIETIAVQEQAAYEQQVKETVVAKVGDLDILMPEILKLAQADGLMEEHVAEIKRNPYLINAGVLINMAQRAKLTAEKASLTAKIADLTKQLAAKPAEVAAKIDAAAKKKPNMTGGSGQSAQAKGVSIPSDPSAIMAMSDADLEAALKAAED